AMNQAVKRNAGRFPEDFVFRLTPAEKRQVVTNCDHLSRLKFSRALPRAFTEHGAIMAASVLNTERAVEVSVYVVRTFVRLREVLASHRDLSAQLAELERRVEGHDGAIRSVVAALRQLMEPPAPGGVRKIGFAGGPDPKKPSP
ncbi:MAG: ORF6N domain-containing protein, partial [Deferrisomatales bacterium]